MGQSIFDWEDEAPKQEVEQPVEVVEYQPENDRQPAAWDVPPEEDAPVDMVDYQPETADETARQGGLAWSAGIVFFSSVAFMLLIGWIADWLFQTSPWGIVGGIILGSIIGFIQFFRIASRIFNPDKANSAMRPLMPHDDEEK